MQPRWQTLEGIVVQNHMVYWLAWVRGAFYWPYSGIRIYSGIFQNSYSVLMSKKLLFRLPNNGPCRQWEFCQTTPPTATRTSSNKRCHDEQNKSSARVSYKILLHFFAVLWKATTWNDQIRGGTGASETPASRTFNSRFPSPSSGVPSSLFYVDCKMLRNIVKFFSFCPGSRFFGYPASRHFSSRLPHPSRPYFPGLPPLSPPPQILNSFNNVDLAF